MLEVQSKDDKKVILKNMLKTTFNLKFADDMKESNSNSLWKKD